jgi:hypothetical protein
MPQSSGARSIKPFALEGGRWWLRQTRAYGSPNLTAMGIQSFLVCSLLILRDLQESEKSENRS